MLALEDAAPAEDPGALVSPDCSDDEGCADDASTDSDDGGEGPPGAGGAAGGVGGEAGAEPPELPAPGIEVAGVPGGDAPEAPAQAMPYAERNRAVATWRCEFGWISYYEKSENFVCECKRADHAGGLRCGFSRTSHGDGDDSSTNWAGRPLGLMMAWLMEAESHVDRDTHFHAKDLDFESRELQRILNGDDADYQALATYERPPKPGEGDEPPTLSGLVAGH